MKTTAALLVGLSLLMWGCGSDNDADESQSELADLLLQDSAGVVDEDCIRDKTDELSEQDAQFLIDNFEATDTEESSDELQSGVDGLIDCFSLAENEP